MKTTLRFSLLQLTLLLLHIGGFRALSAPDEKCGFQFGGRLCSKNACCSMRGVCGATESACGAGCQSGNCRPIPGVLLPSWYNVNGASNLGGLVDKLNQSTITETATSEATTSGTSQSTSSTTSSSSTPLPAELAVCKNISCLKTKTPKIYQNGQYMDCAYEGTIAMTYDDGPDNVNTEPILNALLQRGMKATFFVVGGRAQQFPSLLQRTFKEGHLICQHSHTHPDMSKLTTAQIATELSNADSAIYQVIGKWPSCLRYPYGSITASGAQYAMSRGYKVFYWNLDSEDWVHENPATIMKYYKGNVTTSAAPVKSFITLQHDINDASANVAGELLDFVLASKMVQVNVAQCVNMGSEYSSNRLSSRRR